MEIIIIRLKLFQSQIFYLKVQQNTCIFLKSESFVIQIILHYYDSSCKEIYKIT